MRSRCPVVPCHQSPDLLGATSPPNALPIMRSCISRISSVNVASVSRIATKAFGIAAVTMLLLFIGIHNAWDVVTYMAFERSQPQDNKFGK